jgi:hypothetical protein
MTSLFGLEEGGEWTLESNQLTPTEEGVTIGGTFTGVAVGPLHGGTGLSQYGVGDLLYASAEGTLARLAVATNGYVLQLSGGVPTWGTAPMVDLTLAKDFGTAVPGGNIVRLGNVAGSSQTVPVEIHVGGTLTLKNTSGVTIATFTSTSNTCDLDLKGGLITNATSSSNTVWNGGTIAYSYGGTGKSTLSGESGKVLRVNNSENGYDFYTIPASTQYWSISGNTITPVSSYDLQVTGGLTVGLHFEVDIDGGGTNNHYLRDPGSTAPSLEWFLFWQTSGLSTILNCANGSGSTSLYVGGTIKFGVSDILATCYVPMTINGALKVGSLETTNATSTKILELVDDRLRNKSNVLSAHIIQPAGGTTYPLHILQAGTSSTTSTHNIALANYDSNWSGDGYANNNNFPLLGNNSGHFKLHINSLGDALITATENSKAIVKITNAMRIDGYISTAGNNLVGLPADGTVLATTDAKPFNNSYWQTIHGVQGSFPYWDLIGSDYDTGNINTTGCSLVCNYALFLKGGSMFMACDRRIKHNITEIDDNYALNILNKINMYQFKLNDWFENDYAWNYNVIAQEVLEHFPQAVSRHKDYLSNVMSAVNVNYNKIDTDKYEMVIETKEEWGIKNGGMVKFYCANSKNEKSDILKLECIKNNNTFLIEKEYQYVLCYGIETDDMLTVDKQKIYSLSHSAIQQLHKNNIRQQAEIDILKGQVAMLIEKLK